MATGCLNRTFNALLCLGVCDITVADPGGAASCSWRVKMGLAAWPPSRFPATGASLQRERNS